MKRRAPYAPGDRVAVLHTCSFHGTGMAITPVLRVVPLNENNRWRLEMRRCDGSPIAVVVNERGADRHGYLERVK